MSQLINVPGWVLPTVKVNCQIVSTICIISQHAFTVRANAFHSNSQSGLVRLVHFGNRAESLERLCHPSSPVTQVFTDEVAALKHAICHLAPEQVGGFDTEIQFDHRTDLYSLGVFFWTLVVGREMLPFEGSPLELLHAIVQKKPLSACEVRKDVPPVLSSILDKVGASDNCACVWNTHS